MQISLYFDERNRYAGEIVGAALRRSFSAAQVACRAYDDALATGGATLAGAVLIEPPASAAALIERLLRGGGKALVLGRVEPPVAELLGVSVDVAEGFDSALGVAELDPAQPHNASPGVIRYARHPLAQASPLAERALCRYDFANEWNNLGYGRIAVDGGAWSLALAARPDGCEPIAWLTRGAWQGSADARLYAALRDADSGAALWFNRPVGPVDSGEWRVVETFFADYRADELACFPAVEEIPAGYSAAATMRLDCDEAIGAARPLWELYRDLGFPLSLAVLTGQPSGADDLALLNDVIAGGGAVVAHSVTHASNWGGCYTAALDEARQSKAWLEQSAPRSAPVEFAVSPFHQNPIYAVHALADAGYAGFVGGIIANDPEFLLGRAGQAPFVAAPLVTHSAQCMLHGDCYARYGNSIDAYVETFDNHVRGRSIFGFVDHPFSPRYQYGWADESTRLSAHAGLLTHIGRRANVWRPNLGQALRFLARRNLVNVSANGAERVAWQIEPGGERPAAGPRLQARWRGALYAE